MLVLRELEEVLAHRGALLRADGRIIREAFVKLAGHAELRRLFERRMEVFPIRLRRLHELVALRIADRDRVVRGKAILDHLHARLVLALEVLQARVVVAARRHRDDHALRVAHAGERRARVVDALHRGLVHHVDVLFRRLHAEVAGDAHAKHAHDGDQAEQEQLRGDFHVIQEVHGFIPFQQTHHLNGFRSPVACLPLF